MKRMKQLHILRNTDCNETYETIAHTEKHSKIFKPLMCSKCICICTLQKFTSRSASIEDSIITYFPKIPDYFSAYEQLQTL